MINSILTEWRYRLPAGYPKTAQDFEILRDVILEMTDIDLSEAESIVRRAMGNVVTEQMNPEVPIGISSMYNGRVFRIQNDNNIMIYSEQPFDDHDFNIDNAAIGKIPSDDIDTEQFKQLVNTKSKYNFYRFDTSFKLQKSGVTSGFDIERSVTLNTESFLNAEEFELYVKEHYSAPGQTIGGLRVLYEQLQDDDEVIQLIQSKTPEVTIQPGSFRIQGKFDRLYDAIETNIKIKNGHASELWFSIVFKGVVKGAVKNIPSMGIENDLKSDVITRDGTRFSLKAYNDITFDFGMLPKNAIMYLRSFISLAELITGKKLETSSLGINDINKNILETLNQEQIQEEIKELLKLDSPFSVIKNLQSEIQKILYNMDIESPDYLESVTKRFCVTIDNFIEKHVSENIDYWALIIIPNKTLNLIPSNTIVQSLQHTEENGHYYLSTNISNFHQNHLNIKTSQLGVSAAQYKD